MSVLVAIDARLLFPDWPRFGFCGYRFRGPLPVSEAQRPGVGAWKFSRRRAAAGLRGLPSLLVCATQRPCICARRLSSTNSTNRYREKRFHPELFATWPEEWFDPTSLGTPLATVKAQPGRAPPQPRCRGERPSGFFAGAWRCCTSSSTRRFWLGHGGEYFPYLLWTTLSTWCWLPDFTDIRVLDYLIFGVGRFLATMVPGSSPSDVRLLLPGWLRFGL